MPTQAELLKLKPGISTRKIAMGSGLQLDVQANGRKLWRYRYRLNGKDTRIALGEFPAVSIKQAKDAAFTHARQVADGTDPATAKRQRRQGVPKTGATFRHAWDSWQIDFLKTKPAQATIKKLASQAKALAPIMALTLPAVTPAVIRDLLRDIQGRGHIETSHRLKWRISDVFAHAIDNTLFDGVNPIAGLGKRALAPLTSTPRPAITDPTRLAALLKATDGYAGQPETIAALKLLPMLMARPGELRTMEWAELDLDADEPLWRIPASKMKMRREHLVPLPKQAVSLLEAVRPYSGHSRYCFPNLRSATQPISDNALNAALRAMGFGQAEVCAHGFRSTASTLLNEQGVAPDLIELQLAHEDKSSRAVYNRSKRLADRRVMLQGWADYLDNLR